jgi:hypothetical protein
MPCLEPRGTAPSPTHRRLSPPLLRPADAELWDFVCKCRPPLRSFSWAKAGWAFKEKPRPGRAGKGWRRHWVVFHGAFAFFFADDRLSSPCQGGIYLGACRVEILPRHHGRDHCVQLSSDLPEIPTAQAPHVVVLGFLTPQQLRVWLDYIQSLNAAGQEPESPEGLCDPDESIPLGGATPAADRSTLVRCSSSTGSLQSHPSIISHAPSAASYSSLAQIPWLATAVPTAIGGPRPSGASLASSAVAPLIPFLSTSAPTPSPHPSESGLQCSGFETSEAEVPPCVPPAPTRAAAPRATRGFISPRGPSDAPSPRVAFSKHTPSCPTPTLASPTAGLHYPFSLSPLAALPPSLLEAPRRQFTSEGTSGLRLKRPSVASIGETDSPDPLKGPSVAVWRTAGPGLLGLDPTEDSTSIFPHHASESDSGGSEGHPDESLCVQSQEARWPTQVVVPAEDPHAFKQETEIMPTPRTVYSGESDDDFFVVTRRRRPPGHTKKSPAPTDARGAANTNVDAEAEVALLRDEVRRLTELRLPERWRRFQERHFEAQRQQAAQLREQQRQIAALQHALCALTQQMQPPVAPTAPRLADGVSPPAAFLTSPRECSGASVSLGSSAFSPMPQLRHSDPGALLHQMIHTPSPIQHLGTLLVPTHRPPWPQCGSETPARRPRHPTLLAPSRPNNSPSNGGRTGPSVPILGAIDREGLLHRDPSHSLDGVPAARG